jgi:hypothetical protein
VGVVLMMMMMMMMMMLMMMMIKDMSDQQKKPLPGEREDWGLNVGPVGTSGGGYDIPDYEHILLAAAQENTLLLLSNLDEHYFSFCMG